VIRTGADGWTVAEDAVGAASVPGTLRGLLQARLDALDEDERDLTDRASVIGRVFWDRAVDRLAGKKEEGGDDAYRRLRSREVVYQRPTSTFEHAREFSFRHALPQGRRLRRAAAPTATALPRARGAVDARGGGAHRPGR
jgi:predicted ATPase